MLMFPLSLESSRDVQEDRITTFIIISSQNTCAPAHKLTTKCVYLELQQLAEVPTKHFQKWNCVIQDIQWRSMWHHCYDSFTENNFCVFCEFGKGLTYAPVEGKLIYFNTNGLETFTTVTEPTLLVGSLFFLLQDFITCFSILLNPIYHQPTIIFLAVTSTALYILSSINQAATPHQDNRYFNYSIASRLNII